MASKDKGTRNVFTKVKYGTCEVCGKRYVQTIAGLNLCSKCKEYEVYEKL